MNKRPYTRTESPRVRFPNLTVYPESLDLLRELQENTGMSASLLVEMGLIALRDGDLDYLTCDGCGKMVFSNPDEWAHLSGAVAQAHGTGDNMTCPHCGYNMGFFEQ